MPVDVTALTSTVLQPAQQRTDLAPKVGYIGHGKPGHTPPTAPRARTPLSGDRTKAKEREMRSVKIWGS
eukprot:2809478-Amphidinium_carterae.1